jgi:hypothetical protein
MKTSHTICAIILLALISGCTGQAQTTAEILKNEQQREEIMTAISNNHEMMDEMIGHMMESDNAMQIMQDNQVMIGSLMEKDAAIAVGMMNNMMGGMMMGNEHMINMMRNMGKSHTMMHQKEQGKRKKDGR